MVQVKQIINFTHKGIIPDFILTQYGVNVSLDSIAQAVQEQHNMGLDLSGNKMPPYSPNTIRRKSKALGKQVTTPDLNWSGNLHYLSGNRPYNAKHNSGRRTVSLDFGTSYSKSVNFSRFEDWTGILDTRVSIEILRLLQYYDISKIIDLTWRLK